MVGIKNNAFSRLWIVFFFHGMAVGFWIPVLTNVLVAEGYSKWVAVIFAILPICSLITPLLGGALADERISSQRIYGWASVFAGIGITIAFCFLDYKLPPLWFACAMAAYGLLSGPCWGLLSNIGLTSLGNPEKQFPLVRIGATLGWVLAGVITSYVLHSDSSPIAGYAAGAAHVIAGMLGFFLPDTPPMGSGKSWRNALGLSGFVLFKNRDHAVLFCITAVFSVPLTAFYMFSPELLKALGSKAPTATMTIAQIVEMAAMVALSAMMLKYRLKTMLLWGLGLSAIRFAMCGYAGFTGIIGWHVLGIALHGVCYTFYFLTAQVYMNRRVDPKLRGQAQGLLSFMMSGIGPLIGAVFCGWLHDVCVDANGDGWEDFWWILAGIIAACTAAFALLYQGKRVGD